MAINLPSNPSNGDEYTVSGTTWRYDGTVWNIVVAGVPAGTGEANQNAFSNVAVSGQDTVVADQTTDTLTLVAGSNVTITTNATSDTITFASTGGGEGSGELNQNAFSNVAVSGQTTLSADSATDTLNIAAGSGISISTTESTDTVTISASAGASTFGALTDVQTASVTLDEIAYSAIAVYEVTNSSNIAYLFDSHYSGNNPSLYAISATTIGFKLDVSGHPFEIQDAVGDPYSTGLVHVATDGTISTGSDAQGKTSGTLYWRIQKSVSGTFRYQCQVHAAMVGQIIVKDIALL